MYISIHVTFCGFCSCTRNDNKDVNVYTVFVLKDITVIVDTYTLPTLLFRLGALGSPFLRHFPFFQVRWNDWVIVSVTCFRISVTVVYCTITKSCVLTECISHISEDATTFSWLTHSRKPIRKIYVRLIYVSIRIDKFLSHITNRLELYQLYIF